VKKAGCAGEQTAREEPKRQKGNLNMIKRWRPLTQEELPDLLSGDIVQLRQNYLYNPDRLPVVYVEAQCIEKRKRDGTFLPDGALEPIAPVLMLMNFLLGNNWAESPTPLTRHLRSYT
jgi:hypothetical protein